MMEPVPNGLDRGFKFDPRFERTLFEERSGDMFHVLGMDWATKRPVLHYKLLEKRVAAYHYSGDVLTKEVLPGSRLDLTVSTDIFCTGRMDDAHVPCPGREVLEGFAQCKTCLTQDVPDPKCIFEPHCNSEPCGAFFCQVPHVVYAVVYGTRLKIGMTQLLRVEERGLEQGGDMILPLVQVADRYSARKLEEWISERYGVPQAYPSRTILRDLSRGSDIQRSEERIVRFMERLRREQVMMGDILKGRGIRVLVMPRDMEIKPIVLGPYPVPPSLGSEPREVRPDIIKGEIVGAKGKWCIIKDGPMSAFRMPDLVGRLIMSGTDLGE